MWMDAQLVELRQNPTDSSEFMRDLNALFHTVWVFLEQV